MSKKRKLYVSLFTVLLLVFISFQSVFAFSNATLKEGMKGSDVSSLQSGLKSLGLMSIDPTGYYGSLTKTAVAGFQKKYGLTADGVAGSRTLGKLNSVLSGSSGSSAGSTASRGASGQSGLQAAQTLKSGMRGDSVSNLQSALKVLGFMSIEPTGYFGSITKTAVINFQKKYDLTADGVAGRSTLGKLSGIAGGNAELTATVAKTSVSRGDSERIGEKVVGFAKKLLGVPYVWGGESPDGFDCSGFVWYVFDHFGINLDRVASDQATQGSKISKDDLLPGDLVFFDTNGGHNNINHAGIYIGSGKFIQASSGTHSGVVISNITEGFYDRAFMTARRVLD